MTFVALKTRVCGVNIEWFLFGLYKTLSDPQIPALYGLQSWDYHAARTVAARLLVKSCSKSWNDYFTLRKNQSPYNTLHQNLPWSVPLFFSNFTHYATPPSLTNFASNSKFLTFLKTGQTHSWLFPVFGTFFLQVSAWPTLTFFKSLFKCHLFHDTLFKNAKCPTASTLIPLTLLYFSHHGTYLLTYYLIMFIVDCHSH